MKLNSDSGSSLLEVLVAVVVLALAGTALVSGITLTKVVTDQTSAKSNALTLLDDMAQQLMAMPYQDCSHGAPYAIPAPSKTVADRLDPASVTLEVQVLNPAFVDNLSQEQWISCINSASTSGVQRLFLSAKPYGNDNLTEISKVLIKVRG